MLVVKLRDAKSYHKVEMSQHNSSLGSTPVTRSGERVLLSVLAASGRSHIEGGEGTPFQAGQLPGSLPTLKIKALSLSGGLPAFTPRGSGKNGHPHLCGDAHSPQGLLG